MIFRGLLFLSLFYGALAAEEIKIAVASNVSYAMKALEKEFIQRYPQHKLRLNIGSSGNLSAQIQHGAPYDIFMSANMLYPQKLYDKKLTATKVRVYALGSLAYLSVKERDFSRPIVLLQSEEIEKIAVANPKTAPYGKATLELFENEKVYENIKPKLVYGESISQTLSYTLSAVDIGVVAKSLLFSPKMKKYKQTINWSEVDSKSYSPIEQGIVVLKDAEPAVYDFYDFLFSAPAKKILEDFGYQCP